ncbi:hypothetical protein R1flu_009705 [Riccia fluitans]|uniref:N-acetyltransferase domain-containing protein n=1 Tax=Riccia fluitans TaxID=41844 RepID=A0ABD1Z2W0_9MARC
MIRFVTGHFGQGAIGRQEDLGKLPRRVILHLELKVKSVVFSVRKISAVRNAFDRMSAFGGVHFLLALRDKMAPEAVKTGVYVRLAQKSDVPVIKRLIEGLAEYEKLLDECHATESALEATLFLEPAFEGTTVFILELGPTVEASAAEEGTVDIIYEEINRNIVEDIQDATFVSTKDKRRTVVGFTLFFPSYAPVLAKRGIYIEDIYVREAYRRHGLGTILLKTVAQQAAKRGSGRVEWSVLDWNVNAINFYEGMGAIVLPDVRICRLTGDKLQAYAFAPAATKPRVNVRPAEKYDVPALRLLIEEHAEYEKLTHMLKATEASLEATLFQRPVFDGLKTLILELEHEPSTTEEVLETSQALESSKLNSNRDKKCTIVGFTLFYPTYSTFLAKNGVLIAALYVRETYRGQGLGTLLMSVVAQEAAKRGLGRVEWGVIDRNVNGSSFYERMGASVLPEWRICRLTGEKLQAYAS